MILLFLLSYAATTCKNYLYSSTTHEGIEDPDRTSELQEAAFSGPLVPHAFSKPCTSHLGDQQDSPTYIVPDTATQGGSDYPIPRAAFLTQAALLPEALPDSSLAFWLS